MKTRKTLLIALLCIQAHFPVQPGLARQVELSDDPQCHIGSQSNPGLESVYRQAQQAVVKLKVGNGIGTAFLVSAEGFAITAAHVIRSRQKTTAQFADHTTMDVKIIAVHPVFDLAVVKLESNQALPYLTLEQTLPRAGEAALSIGNSCNDFLKPRFGNVLEVKSRAWAGLEGGLVRLDLPLAPGDSGGPVMNLRGRVFGVVRAGGDDGRGFSSFAVPTNQIASWMKSLLR
jgi:serine protease Do